MSVLKSELFLSRVGRYYWYALILFQLKVQCSDIAIFSRIDFGNFRVGNDTLTLPKFHFRLYLSTVSQDGCLVLLVCFHIPLTYGAVLGHRMFFKS